MMVVVHAGLAAAAGTRSMGKPGSTGECLATPCEGISVVILGWKPWFRVGSHEISDTCCAAHECLGALMDAILHDESCSHRHPWYPAKQYKASDVVEQVSLFSKQQDGKPCAFQDLPNAPVALSAC